MSDCDIITLSSGDESTSQPSQSPPPKSKPTSVTITPKTLRVVSKTNGNASVIQTPEKIIKRSATTEIADDCKIMEVTDPLKSVRKEENVPLKEVDVVAAFEDLLKACRHSDRGQRMENVLEKTEKFYSNAVKEYTSSNEFRDLLLSSTDNISKKPRETFVFLKEVVDELRFHKQKRKLCLTDDQSSKKQKGEAGSGTEPDPAGPSGAGEDDAVDGDKAKNIKRLSKMLRVLHIHIKKLEEKDVDFDDENDSAYIKLERFKERFCKVRKKLCELKDEKFNTLNNGRRITFTGTTYPEINRCIEKFINKTGMFPDYYDVMKLVTETSNQSGLKLSHQQQRKIATDAFLKVGDQLQKSRQYETWNLVSHFLGNNMDPANNNSQLESKLHENSQLSKSKIQNIIDEFAEKQVREKHEAEDVLEEEANNSVAEEDDEEDDESENADEDEELDLGADEELDLGADEELDLDVEEDLGMEVDEDIAKELEEDDGEVGAELDKEHSWLTTLKLQSVIEESAEKEVQEKHEAEEVQEEAEKVDEDFDMVVNDVQHKLENEGEVGVDKVKVEVGLDGDVEAEFETEFTAEPNETVGRNLNGEVAQVNSDGVDAEVNGGLDSSMDMEEAKPTSELPTTPESTPDNRV